MTITDLEARLIEYTQPAGELLGRNMTVDRSLELARLVGNPQQRLRVVHVAGTSGKTSTCYYIAELLRASGSRVGLTVSPHIRSITERVQVDGQPLDDELFIKLMDEYLTLIADWDQRPSYFELMMVFALWVFDRLGVDYAVVETGLGGLHDTSNICRRADKLCVITDIGLDHMHVLGDTVGEIAAQKVGIIAEGNHAVTYRQDEQIMQPIRSAAEAQQATFDIIDPPETHDYRQRNFYLAEQAYSYVQQRDELQPASAAQREQVRATQVPGRLAISRRGASTIIIDGAHNAQKMSALLDTLDSLYSGQQFALVLAMKQGKEYKEVIRQLEPHVTRVVATQFEQVQDAPIRAIDAKVLAQEFDTSPEIAPTLHDALDRLIAANEPLILVTGSLYAASELLQ